jgi:hypothetical protein
LKKKLLPLFKPVQIQNQDLSSLNIIETTQFVISDKQQSIQIISQSSQYIPGSHHQFQPHHHISKFINMFRQLSIPAPTLSQDSTSNNHVLPPTSPKLSYPQQHRVVRKPPPHPPPHTKRSSSLSVMSISPQQSSQLLNSKFKTKKSPHPPSYIKNNEGMNNQI